ncbi:hypothetical protein FB567DRAFT_543107 [Paraphoma chrysanthemicola]|uniref:Carboxylesterase family protein n=1 Tax=Paraphoma chrysanthemicola TaxID=798071 RepID=A0A8K0W501_9PLEO|nr:hypothetical protein FB567DRAFT_543107 [Paraphoma chrysanthemicola]
MRLTRAAQRAQETVDDPTTDATEVKARNPLDEISPNASPELVEPAEEVPKKTPARSKSKKGGKKAKKGKKGKAAEEELEEPVQVVLEDERQDAGSPASEAAAEELDNGLPDGERRRSRWRISMTNMEISDTAQTPVIEERPATPPSKAVRLTRRQLAKQEEELKQSQRAPSPPRTVEPEFAAEIVEQPTVEKAAAEHEAPIDFKEQQLEEIAEAQEEGKHDEGEEAEQAVEDAVTGAQEVPKVQEENALAEEVQAEQLVTPETGVARVSEIVEAEIELIAPSVEITSEPEPKTLATERPSNAPISPAMSRTPSRRASRSPSKSPMRIEASLEAIDALEEALDDVGKAVAHFDQSIDEKSPRKKAFPNDVATPSTRSKTPRKTPLATRVSRTPGAVPKSMKPMASSLARASSVRVAPTKDVRKGSTETVDYLASKRRPVSVSFPTPPPPPKGRAPTKATFQLSSEVTAAKLKAQKEERLKREAEREVEGVKLKPRPISMPPIAKSTKALTKASFELPGEAIAAKLRAQKEERQKREAENAQGPQPKARPVSISMPPPTVKSTKPPTKASFQLPGEAVAARLRAQREERQKREEEAEAAKKAAAVKPRPTAVRKPVALPTRTLSGVTIPPPPKPEPQPAASIRSTSLASKRSSIQLSRSTSVSTTASNPNRNSLLIAKSTVTPVDSAQQKLKGKEVFNRDKMEKEARERERKDKEEAAKQARAQAAERGRIASREWAEKQRRKMMEAVRAKAEAA